MRQYAIDKVSVIWNLLDLTEGLAQGSSIVEARTAPTWSIKPTGYGKVVRVYNPDKSGTLTCLIDQESQRQQDLRGLALADDGARNVVSPFVLIDQTTGEVFTYSNAFIMTQPDEGRGTESGVFPWVWHFETFVKTVITSLPNLVGS